MGANPGGGGTRGRVPPRFFRWGTQYQMSPPPTFWGRMNFGRYNLFFFKAFLANFLSFFFFFLLVKIFCDVSWVPLHILTCATFDADGAPKKKSVGVPPLPPHQLFFFFGGGGLALPLGLAAVEKNVSVPHNPHRICAPALKLRLTRMSAGLISY